MKITIHEEKNSHFTFHEEKKGPITSHENTLYHPLLDHDFSIVLNKLLSVFKKRKDNTISSRQKLNGGFNSERPAVNSKV